MEARPVHLTFDPAVYRLSAVKKAAYAFTDRCHVEIATAHDPAAVAVTLRPRRALDDPAYLVGEFRNEVLDQELREQVAQETEGVRNLLLAQAFSATNLVEPLADTADPALDPLGIARPDGPALRPVLSPTPDPEAGLNLPPDGGPVTGPAGGL